MDFARFLKDRRTKKNLSTAKEHYEELGGEKALGISLRHFQQIESGKYPPSEALLVTMFEKTPPSDHRELILAYFRSVVGEARADHPLLRYLEQSLAPELDRQTTSIWEDGKRRLLVYSEDQLDFLTQNTDAMRLHRRLLLSEAIPLSECRIKADKLKKLVELDLVEIQRDKLTSSRPLYRIPNYDNSPPRLVGKATDYIFKQMEVFSAREGSPEQELSYAMQMISHANAEKIIEQMKYFKKWVQSLGSLDKGPGVVPFLFVGLARKIDRRELQ